MRVNGKPKALMLSLAMLKPINAPKRMQRWVDGPHTPKYEDTLVLLKAAGLLKERPSRRSTPAARDPAQLAGDTTTITPMRTRNREDLIGTASIAFRLLNSTCVKNCDTGIHFPTPIEIEKHISSRIVGPSRPR